jgi:hypothetical protein
MRVMDTWIDKKKILRLIIYYLLVLCCLSCSTSSNRQVEEEFFNPKPPLPKIGQVFYYQHTGSVPWGNGDKDATGKRIIAVTGKSEDKKLWRIEERFEKVEGDSIGFYDDAYNLVRQFLLLNGVELRIEYNTPVNLRYTKLDLDEEKIFEYQQAIFNQDSNEPAGGALIRDKTKRSSYDIRIITPAGAYLCRQFTSMITMQIQMQGRLSVYSGTVNTYWCDKLEWFVKEECTFDPIINESEIVQPGYKTQSVLLSIE